MTDVERPCISVIIPSRDRQEFLNVAVASAIPELQGNDELIVVDDGSEVPLKVVGDRVRVVRLNQNRGQAAARNAGIREARNPLVAFLDSDDSWLPGKLDAQLRIIRGDEGVAVACGWQDINGSGTVLGSRMPRASQTRTDFFAGCWFAPGSTLLLPKVAFERCGPFREDLRRLEDYEWFLRFALAGGRLVVADVIGAKILRSSNAQRATVDAATAAILDAYRTNPEVRPAEHRAMKSWLDLTGAAAARNGGDELRFLALTARSWVGWPRAQLQLQRWWPRGRR